MSPLSTNPLADLGYAQPSIQPATLADLLLRAAERYPDSGVRLFSAERRPETFISYAALLDEALRILGGLRAHGCRPGANIVLLLEHAGDFLPAFWGCALGGYVPCPLAPIRNDAARWAAHLAHIDALLNHPLLVTTRALLPEVSGLAGVDLDTLRAGTPHEPADATEFSYDAPSEDSWGMPAGTVQRDDVAVLVLTSGSTAAAKAVVLTHGNLLASMAAKNERQQLSAADVTLNWISFDHVAALLEAHLLPLYVGAEQVHAPAASILADPLLFLRLINRHRVSMTFAPNFLFGAINAVLQAAAVPLALELSCLRHIISGGEAIVVETGRRFLELLARYGLKRSSLWPAFGMSETCAGSVYSREFPQGDVWQFASLGFPVTGLKIRVVGEDDAPLHAGKSGELQLSGPMVFRRYYNNEEATRAAFTSDGWFRTGDVARIEGGRLALVGRNKDSIIVSGVNYFSHELESALGKLSGIEPAFVAAFPTRPEGADTEQLVVAVATSFPLDDEDKLRQLCIAVRKATVLLWGFRPAHILRLPREAFPKTSLGKIQRAPLRKRFEAGELAAYEMHIARLAAHRPGERGEVQGEAEIAVAEIFGRLFGVDPATLSATTDFLDFGGSSLEIVRLRQMIEQHFGVADLPVATLLQNPTVRALAAVGTHSKVSSYDPIVPLQRSGSGTPLFCVHPASGEVLVFMDLASHFVNERPFLALRARGFNTGESHFGTFDEMVATYVAAIRRDQPRGPYALAGYSYGAPVAFEIAKALETDGERVAFLASIDGPPHIGRPEARFDSIDSTINLAFFIGLIDLRQMQELPAQLRATPNVDYCAHVIDIAPRSRLAELNLDLPRFRAWAQLSNSLVQIGQEYVPYGTSGATAVFYAKPLVATKQDWLNGQLRRWDKLTRAENSYIDVEGEHHTILSPEHAANFYTLLRTEIRRALGER